MKDNLVGQKKLLTCCSMSSKHFDVVHLNCNAMKVLCNEISGFSGWTSCQIPDKLRPNSAAKQSQLPQKQLHLNKSMRTTRNKGKAQF